MVDDELYISLSECVPTILCVRVCSYNPMCQSQSVCLQSYVSESECVPTILCVRVRVCRYNPICVDITDVYTADPVKSVGPYSTCTHRPTPIHLYHTNQTALILIKVLFNVHYQKFNGNPSDISR